MENLSSSFQKVLSAQEIQHIVHELGKKIEQDYAGKKILFVGVLKGAFLFLADLVRCVSLETEIDFVRLSSYGKGKKSSGTVTLLKDVETDLLGKHVLIVEEIVDTGLTLKFLYERLSKAQPASLEIVALLDKPSCRTVSVYPKYIGKKMPEAFLVGYGLDFQEQYRNLDSVYEVQEKPII